MEAANDDDDESPRSPMGGDVMNRSLPHTYQ